MKRHYILPMRILMLLATAVSITSTSLLAQECGHWLGHWLNPTGSPVGGGEQYQRMVDPDDANIVVSSAAELLSALNSAGWGDIVYVADDAVIDLTGTRNIDIPTGVTLASGRGRNGSLGALIFTDDLSEPTSDPSYNVWSFLSANSDVRVTGIRLRGPDPEIREDCYPVAYCLTNSQGIQVNSDSRLEVDNCELSAWSHAAVFLCNSSNANIHHNYIHHNRRHGLGYGVCLSGESSALVEANLFNFNRHDIAGSGVPGQSYQARYNHVMSGGREHSFDMHGGGDRGDGTNIAGDSIVIQHNTFLNLHDYGIRIRGRPTSGCWVSDNWFIHPTRDAAIYQYIDDNLYANDNCYGFTGYYVSWNGKEPWFALAVDDCVLEQIALGDFNGDGVTDFFRADGVNWWVSWSGTSSWVAIASSGYGVESLRFGDFNGDGVTDVFRADGVNWWVSWGGAQTWVAIASSGYGVESLRFGDFNGDGVTDVFRGESASCELPGEAQPIIKRPNDRRVSVGLPTSLILDGLLIRNVTPIGLAFNYHVTAEGPAMLRDNGAPSSLSSTTPLLAPGETFSPPPPLLEIPALGVSAQEYVHYHASALGRPDILDYGTTVISLEPSVEHCLWGWVENGIPLCTATGEQLCPRITSVGAGGAIVTWQDLRSGNYHNYDIYAQMVNDSGCVQWVSNGVALCTATGDQSSPMITSDGAGGAIVTWNDSRSGNNDIYAQRVNASSFVQWVSNGVALCTATGDQSSPMITSDGAGGAIVTWNDWRSGSADVYAQRVNASGNVLWTTNGVAICTAEGSQSRPRGASDGAGGAIITWGDCRSGSADVYAQRVNASGDVLWTTNGVAICTDELGQYYPEIVTDGAQGGIIAWEDERFAPFALAMYAQRVDANGVTLWTADGVRLCDNVLSPPRMISDGVGGAIITWEHYPIADLPDIHAGRVSENGETPWWYTRAVCTAHEDQRNPEIVSDGAGGAIIAWNDGRSYNPDIYAQRVCANGSGPTSVIFASATATVETGWVTLSWRINERVLASSFRIQRSESLEGEFLTLDLPISVNSGLWFSCTDYSVQPGKTYWYKIVLVGSSGEESYGPIEVRVDAVPVAYMAYQSYPNPFNPMCTIRYDIPTAAIVRLTVFKVDGSLMRTLVDARREPGVYSEIWDGCDDAGKQLPSGIYFYRLEAGDFVATRKMVLLK